MRAIIYDRCEIACSRCVSGDALGNEGTNKPTKEGTRGVARVIRGV